MQGMGRSCARVGWRFQFQAGWARKGSQTWLHLIRDLKLGGECARQGGQVQRSRGGRVPGLLKEQHCGCAEGKRRVGWVEE